MPTRKTVKVGLPLFIIGLTSLVSALLFSEELVKKKTSLTPVRQTSPTYRLSSSAFKTAVEQKALTAYRIDKDRSYKGEAYAKSIGDGLMSFRVKKLSPIKLETSGRQLFFLDKQDAARHFTIDTDTGDISFHKGMRGYTDLKPVAGLPKGEDNAVKQAKAILSELKLMPENEREMVVRHVGGLKLVERSEDGKTTEVDKLVTVHFGRKLDGIDVGGPGSKIVVSMGRNGELVALTRRWTEVRKEAKSTKQFYSKPVVEQNLKARLSKELVKARSIQLAAPEVGYYDDGKGNIEPAYFFTADLEYEAPEKGEQIKEKYFGALPALSDSRADFVQMEKSKKAPTLMDVTKMKSLPERDNTDD